MRTIISTNHAQTARTMMGLPCAARAPTTSTMSAHQRAYAPARRPLTLAWNKVYYDQLVQIRAGLAHPVSIYAESTQVEFTFGVSNPGNAAKNYDRRDWSQSRC